MTNNTVFAELIEAAVDVDAHVIDTTGLGDSPERLALGNKALERLSKALIAYNARSAPTTDDFCVGNPQWEDNSIQFPRFIAECEAAGFFSQSEPALEDCFGAVCASMDLVGLELAEIIERAQTAWEEAKMKHCPPPTRWKIGDVVCDMHNPLDLPKGCKVVSKTVVELSGGCDMIQGAIAKRLGQPYLYTNKDLVILGEGLNGTELAWSYDDMRFGLMTVKGLME